MSSSPRSLALQRMAYPAAVAGLVLLVVAATWLVAAMDPHRVNLARGAVVTTSSREPPFLSVQGAVDGKLSELGFHTRVEDSPWVMLDLGAEKTISRVLVYNRMDRAVYRARQLIMELSRDGVQFTPVGQHNDEFQLWEQTFPPIRVRFVRLRLPRRDYLHLREVEVFE